MELGLVSVVRWIIILDWLILWFFPARLDFSSCNISAWERIRSFSFKPAIGLSAKDFSRPFHRTSFWAA
jgi:hypothetical protein